MLFINKLKIPRLKLIKPWVGCKEKNEKIQDEI